MWIKLEIVDKWINLWIKEKKLCRIKGKKLSIDELLGFHYNSFRCLPKIRSLFGTFVRTNNSRRNDWWHWPYTKKREVSVCIREKWLFSQKPDKELRCMDSEKECLQQMVERFCLQEELKAEQSYPHKLKNKSF